MNMIGAACVSRLAKLPCGEEVASWAVMLNRMNSTTKPSTAGTRAELAAAHPSGRRPSARRASEYSLLS